MTHLAKKLVRLHSYPEFSKLDGHQEGDKTLFFLYSMPLSLHGLMFITTLKNLCDPEQVSLFLEPALRG